MAEPRDARPQPADRQEPGDRPPARRILDRPPSARYAGREPSPEPGSVRPPVLTAVGIAGGGAILVIVLAGVLSVSLGILVIAVLVGRFVGLALRAGRGRPPGRAVLAAGLAAGSLALGYLGTWAYARTEGGVLAPLDYLGQTFGLVVPIAIAVSAVTAWATAG